MPPTLIRTLLLLTCTILVAAISCANCHLCAHHKITRKQKGFIGGAAIQNKNRNLRADNEKKPIRIHTYYADDKIYLPKPSKKFLKNVLMPDVVNYFTSALSVTPLQGNLSFLTCSSTWTSGPNAGKCRFLTNFGCGPSFVTEKVIEQHFQRVTYCPTSSPSSCYEYGGGGIPNTDFIIYVFSMLTDLCKGGTLGFANACVSYSNGQPFSGYINFCPNYFDIQGEYETMRHLGIHEVFHALGFANSYFRKFSRPNGTSYDAIKFTNINSRSVALLASPKVVEIGREFFNCSTLEGVELEDYGAFNGVGSHWEMKILRDEVMTAATITGIRRIESLTRFTLAALEDSGWYKANFSAISNRKLLWGRGLGCRFITGSCQNSTNYPYVCNIGSNGCTYDYDAAGICGTNPWMNGCTVMVAAVNSVCFGGTKSSDACDPVRKNAKCILSRQGSSNTEQGFCIQHTCVYNPIAKQVQIKISYGGEQKICRPGVSTITFSQCNRTMICPPIEKACARANLQLNGMFPQLCPANCRSCHNISICSVCQDQFYIYAGSCYEACPTGSFHFPNRSTCFNVGTNLQVQNEIIFPLAEKNVTGMATQLIANFKSQLQSLAAFFASITVSINSVKQQTIFTVVFQGKPLQLNNAQTILRSYVMNKQLTATINGQKVVAMNVMQNSPPLIVIISNTTVSPTTSTQNTIIWEQVYGGLKVWAWTAIGGGVALFLILLASIGCFLCGRSQRPSSGFKSNYRSSTDTKIGSSNLPAYSAETNTEITKF
ncbi:Leishmanolysin-like peptidase [Trichoplax sp. H2]|nr:Leishmanolysin-like peptidase [Trichoplax sp. H2]|eukprot:RDD40194.1 Leishmanolysin-like peptidase [Trichoplax sp. H2]